MTARDAEVRTVSVVVAVVVPLTVYINGCEPAAVDAMFGLMWTALIVMAVNAANFRTEFDAAGNAVRIEPCYGDYRVPFEDDCLAPHEPRAWSSPIYVDWAVADG